MGVHQDYSADLIAEHAGDLDGNPTEYVFDNSLEHIQAGKRLLRRFFAPHVLDLYRLLEAQGIDFPGFEDFPRGGEW